MTNICVPLRPVIQLALTLLFSWYLDSSVCVRGSYGSHLRGSWTAKDCRLGVDDYSAKIIITNRRQTEKLFGTQRKTLWEFCWEHNIWALCVERLPDDLQPTQPFEKRPCLVPWLRWCMERQSVESRQEDLSSWRSALGNAVGSRHALVGFVKRFGCRFACAGTGSLRGGKESVEKSVVKDPNVKRQDK